MKFRQRKKNIRKFLVSKEPYFVGKGVQYIYRFPNGLGASVIKFEVRVSRMSYGSYGHELGLYEMGLLNFTDEEQQTVEDVVGYLTPKDVVKKLERISKGKQN